jgi:hypothetical protein
MVQDEASWEAILDPATGHTYYRNVDTDETAWEYPTGIVEGGSKTGKSSEPEIVTQPVAGSKSPKLASDSDLFSNPSDWEAIIDPSSGHHYYRNLNTDETTWDRPVEMGS